ncbi:MAG: SGNH/GDSL hydrolase family protein, partial [Planctomycetales bacterium]|nr:SGNH/GDSL hydrolase family protein [Planctomycetales bacterium]
MCVKKIGAMPSRFGAFRSVMMWLLGAFASMSVCAAAHAGERVVFLGDSITQAGVAPNGYVTLVRKQLEAAGQEVDVVGAGIGGNRVPDLQARLERDVLSKDPTLVVIYIGINDVWHSLRDRGTSKDDYRAGLLDIIRQIKAKGASVILCTASVIGEKTDGSNQLDAMLDEYCGISREVAKETGSQLLDLRKAFIEYLTEHNSEQKSEGILTTDGVHLNDAGNEFV